MIRLRPTALAAALALLVASASEASPRADPQFDAIAARTRADMLADPVKAVGEAREAQRLAIAAPAGPSRDLMVATASWLLGEAYIRSGQADQARPLIQAAVRQASAIAPGSELLAEALLSRGGISVVDGNVAKAMADFHNAHDLFQTLDDARGRARAFALIANLYYDANDWTNALRYFSQALDVYRADPGLAVSIYNGRGVALRELNKTSAAIGEFKAGLAIARKLKSPALTATILRNMARASLAADDLPAADAAIAESTRLAQGAPIAFRRTQFALAAQAAYQHRNYPQAEALIAKAFDGVDLAATTLGDRDSHKTAYDVYKAVGRDDLALAHLAALKRLDDEATELARSNGAALMAARFDFANQELRIANLKASDLQKTVENERQRARAQQTMFLGGTVATLVIFAMLAFGIVTLRRSRDKVRAANTDLAATNVALEKALAAKTEFLATTSHEIRTPLNGILGMTQVMLADPKVDAATRDRVTVVHGAGITMRALVDDILDVAKMETGNLTIEMVAFDLAQTLRDSTRMWQEQARGKGLAFAVDLADCPAGILGDPSRIRQIVFNLLSNALKFTPSGAVSLAVRAESDRYRIVVRDTGIGIAPDKHEEIFESFRQADAGTTRQFGGTGLGLTICRNLSRAMQGDVTVESAEGQGATFTLDLPLERAVLVEDAVVDTACAAGAGLLVVDRNPITRAMLKTLLESRAGAVTVAASLEDAAEAARGAGRILIDEATAKAAVDLPAAIAAIRVSAPAAPIMLLWPGDDADGQSRALAAGVTRILAKPMAKAALIDAVCDETIAITDMKIMTQAA